LVSVYPARIILVRSYAALSDVLFELSVLNLAQNITCSDRKVLSLELITGISRNISPLPLTSTSILFILIQLLDRLKSDLLTASLNKVQINANYARCFITSAADKLSEVDLVSNQQKHPSVKRYLFREIKS
jgi:hypothetical protein